MATISYKEFLKKAGGTSKEVQITSPSSIFSKVSLQNAQSTPAIETEHDLGGKILREIPPTAGFFIGEAAGGPAGAGVGSALGETVSQYGEKALGERRDIDIKKIVEAGLTGILVPPILKKSGEILKPVAEVALKSGGKTLEPLVNIARTGILGIKKVLPGISDETSLTIKEFPKEVETLAKQKTLPLNPLLERVDSARNALRKTTTDEFSSGLNKIKQQYPFGKTGKILISKEMESETVGLPRALRKYRIGVSQDGTLNFDKFPSAIRSQAERNAIQDAYNLVKNQTDFSVQGVQDTAAALRKATDYVAGDRTVSSAAASAISDAYDAAIRKAYPELGVLRDTYSSRQKLLKILDNLAPDNKAWRDLLSPTGIAKLRSLTKEEIGTTYKDFFTAFKKETGMDLEKELRLYSAAREINPNLIPQDTGGLTRAVQRAANPLIGQFHLEISKFLNSETGQAIQKQSPVVWELLKTITEKAANLGVDISAFQAGKEGINKTEEFLNPNK